VFALFGGVGTLAGPLLGALLLYSMYNFIGISTPQYFQLFYGFLIIGLVLFLPDGVASILQKGKVYVP
jgi:branched-chain amino acid transport system permease protein